MNETEQIIEDRILKCCHAPHNGKNAEMCVKLNRYTKPGEDSKWLSLLICPAKEELIFRVSTYQLSRVFDGIGIMISVDVHSRLSNCNEPCLRIIGRYQDVLVTCEIFFNSLDLEKLS